MTTPLNPRRWPALGIAFAVAGTAAVPRAHGQLESLEVVFFPEAVHGSGAGHCQCPRQEKAQAPGYSR